MPRRTFPVGRACAAGLLAAACGRIGYEPLGLLADAAGDASREDATASSSGGAKDEGGPKYDAAPESSADAGAEAALDATIDAPIDATADGASDGATDAPADAAPEGSVDAGYPYPSCPALRVWSFVFDSDPTQIEWSGDAGPEWVVRGGGAFPVSELEGGVWRSTTGLALDTRPLDDFPDRVLIDVRMRNLSVAAGQHGAVVWINMNETAPQFSAVFGALALDPDGGQTFSVWGKPGPGTETALATFPGLAEAMVDVHLDVDPASSTVGVWLDGVSQGSYPFPPTGPPNTDHFATLISLGGTSEFESVEIQHCVP
jgi:hypothetical protein